MNKYLVVVLVFLVFVFMGEVFYYYYFPLKYGWPQTQTSPIARKNTSSPSLGPTVSPLASTPTPTAPQEEKTVKDVHCLQNPQRNELIRIFSPADYSVQKGSSLTFQGTATVFEGTFQFRLKDCRGPILAEGTAQTVGDSTEGASFEETTDYILSRSPMDAILELFEISMADGSEIHLTQVPVRLTQ